MGIQFRGQQAFFVHQHFHDRQLEVECIKVQHGFRRLGQLVFLRFRHLFLRLFPADLYHSGEGFQLCSLRGPLFRDRARQTGINGKATELQGMGNAAKVLPAGLPVVFGPDPDRAVKWLPHRILALGRHSDAKGFDSLLIFIQPAL